MSGLIGAFLSLPTPAVRETFKGVDGEKCLSVWTWHGGSAGGLLSVTDRGDLLHCRIVSE